MSKESKTKALHKAKDGEGHACKKCGKEKSHAIHRNEDHVKFHEFQGLANNLGKPKERGDEKEAKEERSDKKQGEEEKEEGEE